MHTITSADGTPSPTTAPALVASGTGQQSHIEDVHGGRIRHPFDATYGHKRRLQRVQQLTAMILVALSSVPGSSRASA
jgi:hypothetical protein